MNYKHFASSFMIVGCLLALTFYLRADESPAETNTTYLEEIETPIETVAESTGSSAKIQVALLLDTSGSMDGLIEQAKSQLWNILNQFSKAEYQGNEPDLEIALYEYGNPSKARNRNQILQLSDFTTDMDLISEKLFALKTDGGEEYCGSVIKSSIDELNWDKEEGFKVIYIAGNESFRQGPVNATEAVSTARDHDIIVNTIFCGPTEEGKKLHWLNAAQLGMGEYMNIDQNQVTLHIESPYDDRIGELNTSLNNTYIPFGAQGESKKQNQVQQDLNSNTYGKSNLSSRAKFKVSKKYKAEDWDLVDAYKKDKKVLENADVKSEKHRDLSREDLEKAIQEASAERSSIQTEISELNKKRDAFIAKEKAKNAENQNRNGLEESVLKSVEKQIKSRGFNIKQ